MRKMLTVLVAGLVAFATANAQNLVPNGNFESWDDANTPTGWTYESGVTFEQHSDTVYQGTYAAKVTLTTQDQSNTDTESDFFAVTAGQDYEFSFWILDNDPAGEARLVVRWYDASQNYITVNYGAYSSDDPNWQRVSGTYTAPSNAAYAKFCFRFYDISGNWDGDAVFYIDSVVAVQTTPTIYDVTIYEIQGQASSSPYEGEKVRTHGIVSGVFGNGFFMEERPGGAWHGIWVYTSSAPSVNVGDSVEVVADVQEYYGLTELSNPNITVLQSGLTPPGPTVITLADYGEAYEGVFVRVENVVVSDPDLGYGEWEITDRVNTGRVDDMGNYTYQPALGDSLIFVQGPLTYTYGNYKMEPRDDGDINQAPTAVAETEFGSPLQITLRTTLARNHLEVAFSLPRASEVSVALYNAAGQRVQTLWQGTLPAGEHVQRMPVNLKAGVYFVTAKVDGHTVATHRLVIVR